MVRVSAAGALRRLGGSEKTLAKLLSARNENAEERRYLCALGLGYLDGAGKGQIAVLVAALGDGSPKVRTQAQQSLAALGEIARKKLASALAAPLARVRFGALCALEGNQDVAANCVPAIMGRLTDAHRCVRAKAARVLGALGPRARLATKLLTVASRDPVESVRREAKKALEAISGD